jgi:hypothetical protein
MNADTRSPRKKWTDRIVASLLIIGVVVFIVWSYQNNFGQMRNTVDAFFKSYK